MLALLLASMVKVALRGSIEQATPPAWNLSIAHSKELKQRKVAAFAEVVAKAQHNDCLGGGSLGCSAMNECCPRLSCNPDTQFLKMLCVEESTGKAPNPGAKRQIVITSHPRSGSTFLQGMFESVPQNFIIFEPCFFHGRKDCIDTMSAMLVCNITETDYKDPQAIYPQLKRSGMNECGYWARWALRGRKQKWKHDASEGECLQRVAHDCRAAAGSTVVKEVRMNGKMRELVGLSVPPRHVMVLHLVRDPRAVINSLMGNWAFEEWPRSMDEDLLKEMAEKMCDETYQDLQAGNKSVATASAVGQRSYMMIRYEDLVMAPLKWTERIHKELLGTPVPLPVKWFVDTNTKGNCKSGQNRWSTCRNATQVISKWRKELSDSHTAIVTGAKSCRKVLDVLGYEP
jgi:hypothetical protein